MGNFMSGHPPPPSTIEEQELSSSEDFDTNQYRDDNNLHNQLYFSFKLDKHYKFKYASIQLYGTVFTNEIIIGGIDNLSTILPPMVNKTTVYQPLPEYIQEWRQIHTETTEIVLEIYIHFTELKVDEYIPHKSRVHVYLRDGEIECNDVRIKDFKAFI